MNIYGDRGNVIVLQQRARWRGINVEVHTADVGDPLDLDQVDLVFAGGGQDDQQIAVARDLQGRKGQQLRELAEDDAPMLLVCGTYQLFGRFFRTGTGNELPGIGVFDAHTVAGTRRLIGDALVETEIGLAPSTLVGFENHSGQTFLGSGCRRLGRTATMAGRERSTGRCTGRICTGQSYQRIRG
jgi:CobQ-like glutamine amidotransferase family enzyme